MPSERLLLALDPATKCGVAFGRGRQLIVSGVWDLSPRRDESKGMRLIHLDSRLCEFSARYDLRRPKGLVVFEGVRHAKANGPMIVQAEIQGHIKFWCEENDIDYRAYGPQEIKKHATDRGNASKEEMVAAAQEKWPERNVTDHNEADALFLFDLAASQYAAH
jgi:Holliday junction resolvasome RuvABC endonuclease subunit